VILAIGILLLGAVLIMAGLWMTSDIAHVLVFAGFPALLVGLAGRLDLQAITWFKVFTLCAAILAIHFAPKLSEAGRRNAKPAIYLLLLLNISEPAAYDALAGRWFGAALAAGIMLLTPRWSAIGYSSLKGRTVLTYDLPWLWIASYTLWNASFVATAYPAHASDHIAVLSAPLILAFSQRNRKMWFQHRALTLSLYAVLVVAANDVAGVTWIPALGGSQRVHGIIVIAAWVLLTCYVVVRLLKRVPRQVPAQAGADLGAAV